jgi:hypothetical protein
MVLEGVGLVMAVAQAALPRPVRPPVAAQADIQVMVETGQRFPSQIAAVPQVAVFTLRRMAREQVVALG